MPIEFARSAPFTLGVEMELQLIDGETFDLTPAAIEVLKVWGGRDDRLKPELLQSMLEINTGICRTATEAEAELVDVADQVRQICRAIGVRVASTGSHPTAKYAERRLYPSDRYHALIDRNRHIARRLMIFGLHVHIGTRDGEHCMALNNELLHVLPLFLALSASSPYWQGEDTGLASARSTVFEALPTGGHPSILPTWSDFEELVDVLMRCGAITSFKDIWWDIRPSPNFGTLEIRVCDGLATVAETAALTAFIHCMALDLDERLAAGRPQPLIPIWLVRENKWRAARHGLNADFVRDADGAQQAMREAIAERLDRLARFERQLSYERHFAVLRTMLERGASYERQRRVCERTTQLRDVVRSIADEFDANAPAYA